MLLDEQRLEGEHEQADGLVLLEADNSIAFADLPAEMWLADLAGERGAEPLPPVVAAVAARARSIAPHELAPLAAEAYELTERERAVTEPVAQGLATTAIADRLYISAWTVQDHLKSIFEKVGVGTRGELIARVFFAPDVPSLTDGWAQSRSPGLVARYMSG